MVQLYPHAVPAVKNSAYDAVIPHAVIANEKLF